MIGKNAVYTAHMPLLVDETGAGYKKNSAARSDSPGFAELSEEGIGVDEIAPIGQATAPLYTVPQLWKMPTSSPKNGARR